MKIGEHKLNMADAVTACRIVSAVLILLCSVFSMPFFVFCALGGISDMTDGWIARKWNLSSSFGAVLDTIADAVFMMTVLIKVLPVLSVPSWLWIWIAVIALIKAVNLLSGFIMFRRIAAVHSIMNKLAGFILFLLPFVIRNGSSEIFVTAACSIATFAAVQEGHYIRTGKVIE